MGKPVVHFEVVGKDGEGLRNFYSELCGWEIDTNNPMNYGVVDRDSNLSPEGFGIGGGVGVAPNGYEGHVTFYIGSEDVGADLSKAESLGGTRVMGPDEIDTGMGKLVLGQFKDPEGHLIGLVQPLM